MEYIDTYHYLNPHLHTTEPSSQFDVENIYSITRNPPIILRDATQLTVSTMSMYKFSPKIFEKHEVLYPLHVVNCLKKNPKGNFKIINACTQWGNGYYHFITEVLPSVLEIGKPLPIFILPSKFAQPVFKWFSLNNDVIFEMPSYENIKESYEQQYIECGNPSQQKIDLIRNAVVKKVSFTRTKGILIFRREAQRTIINSNEVLEMLKRIYPMLEWVVFDVLSFADTVTLFSSAAIIVAPHGAGLTNMLFSDSGIPIIEFMSLQNPNICYWHLSELLKNKYYMIPCITENRNFNIDISNVEELLKNNVKLNDI
jgi:hypothetical protein